MSRPIRLGHRPLSFHEASAREVERLLVARGHRVERSSGGLAGLFERLGKGEIDLFVSAWLPLSHERFYAAIANKVRRLAVLYRPYRIWGVPGYVPESEVASVADLLGAPALARMDRRIHGIATRAGISRHSVETIRRYGLDVVAGYRFQPGTEADCFARFMRAYAERRWVVVPLWHPQSLHRRYAIRALEEPLGLLGGVDEATMLVHRGAESAIGRETLDFLAQLTFGNARVSALDDALIRERAEAAELPERRFASR